MCMSTFKTSHVLLLLLSVQLMNGCRDRPVVPAEPSEPDAFGLRLFTNGSEIKDAVVKDRFLRHIAGYSSFLYLPIPYPGDKVSFPVADTAVLNSIFFDRGRFSIVKKTPQYLFYSAVPNTVYSTSLSIPPASGRLMYDMLKYTSPLLPYPIGGASQAICKQVHVGYEHDNKIYMSFLRYQWVWANQLQGNMWRSGWIFNEFNESVIPKIGVGDTLAIRFDKLEFPIK